MTDPTPAEIADLILNLNSTPLYEGGGDESDLPEQAADALAASQAQVERLRAENGALRTMIRVNAMRDHGMTHAEVDAAMRAALSDTQPPEAT